MKLSSSLHPTDFFGIFDGVSLSSSFGSSCFRFNSFVDKVFVISFLHVAEEFDLPVECEPTSTR